MARRKTVTGLINPNEDKILNDLDLINDPVYLKLKTSQQRFIYYLYLQKENLWTNSETYRRAYKNYNCPTNQASVHYNGLKKDDRIQHCVKKLEAYFKRQLDLIPQRILREESYIAFSDIAKYFDSEGHLTIHPSKLPAPARRAIGGIKRITQKDGSVVYEVSLWNKGAALARLQNVYGMNSPNKLEISGPNGNPIEIDAKYDFTLLSYEEKKVLKTLLIKCKIE
jgi:hypothetical protein